MMNSEEVLSVYQAMGELTAQMVKAAGNGDWDELVLLEQRCAAHVRALKENEPAQPMQGPSRLKKVQMIKKLLDDDRKIRDLTMPWMAQLSAMINSSGTERRLASAYGVA